MESFQFQKPKFTREQWVEQLDKLGDEIREIFNDDRSTWDRLTYFSKTLSIGVEMKHLLEAGFKWFSNTKVAESLDKETGEAMYVGSYNSLINLIETFQDVVDAQIRAEKSDDEIPAPMKYVS